MNFSTNQVRQMYVGTFDEIGSGNDLGQAITNGTANQYFVKTWDDKDHRYHDGMSHQSFEIIGTNVHGTPIHSDIVLGHNIRSMRLSSTTDLATKACAIQLSKNATVTLHAGDNVYVNFTFPAYISLTPEEDMTKTVVFTLQNPTNFATELAKAINLAFQSNYNTTNSLVTATVSGANVIVKANVPTKRYRRGLFELTANNFIVNNLTFEDMSDPTLSSLPLENNSRIKTWGVATDVTSTAGNTIPGGYKLADLEYFCMGERGDVYRGIGWPNNIETKYVIDPTNNYDIVDIHYFYQGEGINDDKSEKVMTLVCPSGAGEDLMLLLLNSDSADRNDLAS